MADLAEASPQGLQPWLTREGAHAVLVTHTEDLASTSIVTRVTWRGGPSLGLVAAGMRTSDVVAHLPRCHEPYVAHDWLSIPLPVAWHAQRPALARVPSRHLHLRLERLPHWGQDLGAWLQILSRPVVAVSAARWTADREHACPVAWRAALDWDLATHRLTQLAPDWRAVFALRLTPTSPPQLGALPDWLRPWGTASWPDRIWRLHPAFPALWRPGTPTARMVADLAPPPAVCAQLSAAVFSTLEATGAGPLLGVRGALFAQLLQDPGDALGPLRRTALRSRHRAVRELAFGLFGVSGTSGGASLPSIASD